MTLILKADLFFPISCFDCFLLSHKNILFEISVINHSMKLQGILGVSFATRREREIVTINVILKQTYLHVSVIK